MDFIDDDVLQAREKTFPAAVVVRQNACVQHVGIRDHEVGGALDVRTFLAGRVAVERAEFAKVHRFAHEAADGILLIAREGLGRIQQQNAERRFRVHPLVEQRKEERERLAAGRARNEDDILLVANRLERFGLMGVQAPDAVLLQYSAEARVQRRGQIRKRSRQLRQHLMRADLLVEFRLEKVNRVSELGGGRSHVGNVMQRGGPDNR